ncbi:hypothetical protein [Streptomyces sp. NPDC059092]|uniref:hypothetical protein n=1 Tax=Streptomyces sp. NPDC059092 TaxID=3346725 RepID=UPI0036CF23AB
MDQRLTTSTRTDDRQENGGTGAGADPGEGRKGPRLELSLPQVAGSALAAVAAAVLASQLGVYGTIIGAGLVSVIATCGGSVFQHLFRRTGEQIRVAAVQAKPTGRQVPIPPERGDPGRRDDFTGSAGSAGAVDATRLPPQVSQVLQVSRASPTAQTPQAPHGPPGEEFTRATTHGTRVRGWKRPVLAACIVFGVAMGGITGYELISGQDLSGGTGTTVGSVASGGGHRSTPSTTTDPSSTPSTDTGTGTGGDTNTTPGGGVPPSPSGSGQSGGTGQETGTGSGADTGTDPTGTPSTTAPEPADPSGSGPDSTGGSGSGASSAPAPTPSGTAGTTTGGGTTTGR